jgi:hypothetical protein
MVFSFLRFALMSLVASAAAGGFASCPGQKWYEKSTVLLHRAFVNRIQLRGPRGRPWKRFLVYTRVYTETLLARPMPHRAN